MTRLYRNHLGHRAGLRVLVGAERDERAADLGHPVHLPESAAEPFDGLGVDVGGHGRGPVQDLAQGREVRGVGGPGAQQEAQHLRDEPDVGGAVGLDGGQRGLRFEAGHQDHGRARGHVRQRDDHAAVVERAAVDQHHVVGGPGHGEPAERDGPERGVVDGDALGLAGRRRGVQDRRGGVVRDVVERGSALGAERGERLVVQGDAGAHRQIGVAGQQRGLADHGDGAGAFDDPGHLGGRQAVVERDEERPDAGQREVRLQDLDPVQGEHGDAVTAPDAEPGEPVGEADAPVVELGPGDGAVLVHQGRPVREALAVALRQLGQPHQAAPCCGVAASR